LTLLVDIDHSPRQLLHPSHASLYDESGLRDLAERLNPGGAFGLWSNDRPDQQFCQNLDKVFAVSRAQIFTFPNLLKDCDEAATIYIAVRHLSPEFRSGSLEPNVLLGLTWFLRSRAADWPLGSCI
jgi:hypothetical protein